jgi:hypothetical protein
MECHTTVETPGTGAASSRSRNADAGSASTATGCRTADLQRPAEPLEALHLVGPDVRRQREPVVGAARVERCRVAAAPLDQAQHDVVRRQRARPRVAQHDG